LIKHEFALMLAHECSIGIFTAAATIRGRAKAKELPMQKARSTPFFPKAPYIRFFGCSINRSTK
jgi:hypothetical protein